MPSLAVTAPRRPSRRGRARVLTRVCRAGAGGLVVALSLVASASTAGAHATLIASDPADGAQLDEAPEEVRLTFSEPVSASLGGLRVVAADGQRVDEGAVRVDGAVVSVDLADDLDDGTYVVTYRIVSADGHPVRGAAVFGVGPDPVDATVAERLGDGGSDRAWEVVGAVGRGLAYAGTLLAAGGALFLLAAYRAGPDRSTLVRVVRGAAIVGAVAGCVALPVQAALGTGRGAGALFDDGVLREVLDDGVGLGLLLAVLGLTAVALGVVRHRLLTAIGAVVAAASFAATGHTRAGDHRGLTTASDAVHLVVVAVWAGGIVLLLLTVVLHRRRSARADPDGAGPVETVDGTSSIGAVVVRFAAAATVALGGASATGVVLSWQEVRTIDALTGTGYGQLLLVKLAVVGAVAALGAYNHFRLVPAVRLGKVRAALRHLRATLALEAVGVLAVVGITAVLVVVTPARTEAAGGPVERIVDLGDVGSVQIVVAPARVGANQIHLYTYDTAGRPAHLADTVEVELSLPAAGIGPIDRTATRAGPAHAQLDGSDLAVAGTWEITIRVRVDRFTEVSARTEVPIRG